MKANANRNTQQNQIDQQQRHDAGRYTKVTRPGKGAVRGLWRRGASFYAQLTVIDETTGLKVVKRTRLEDPDGKPVTTIPRAEAVLGALKAERMKKGGVTLDPKRTPRFQETADAYLARITEAGLKAPKTIRGERTFLLVLKRHLGELRLNQITRPAVNGYVHQRRVSGVCARTCNLEVVVLRNVLRFAVDQGILRHLPFDGVKPLKHTPERQRLMTPADLDKLCDTAVAEVENGVQFADLLRVLCYSGGRIGETLALRWSDVDWQNRQLTFGNTENTKNRERRVLDFNEALETQLQAMLKRRQPDTDWIFPRFRRGERDVHLTSPNGTLRVVRVKAGLPWFHLHLTRHHFISYAVMAGVDILTVAKWVGHKDGGVLIGKTYGHLTTEHRQLQAMKLTFAPRILPSANEKSA